MKKWGAYNYFLIKDCSENYPEGTKPFTYLFCDEYYPNSCHFENAVLLIRTKDEKEKVIPKIFQLREKYRHNFYKGMDNWRFAIYEDDEFSIEYPSENTQFISGKKMWHFLKTVVNKKIVKEKQEEKQLALF